MWILRKRYCIHNMQSEYGKGEELKKMDIYRVLAINPGSTSTKIAIYDNEKEVFEETLRHPSEEINKYDKIFDQYDFRKKCYLRYFE